MAPECHTGPRSPDNTRLHARTGHRTATANSAAGTGVPGAPPHPPRDTGKTLLIPVPALHNGGKVKNPLVVESPGVALVARIRDEMKSAGLVPDGREEELLALASGLADRLVELEGAIADDGLTTVSKSGVVHLHPAVCESRQTRAALARVLSGIQMEDSSKDSVKQAAAQSRWRAHNEAKQKVQSL